VSLRMSITRGGRSSLLVTVVLPSFSLRRRSLPPPARRG